MALKRILVVGLITFHLLVLTNARENPISISQISPKSSYIDPYNDHSPETIIIESSQQIQTDLNMNSMSNGESDVRSKRESHVRIERSALPTISNAASNTLGLANKLEHIDTNEVDSMSGRYFKSLDPTQTIEQSNDKAAEVSSETSSDSFFLRRGPRLLGAPVPSPNATKMTLTAPQRSNDPRQSSNPDIQDIISGIVKLLNGNVNVHASSGPPSRRPYTRINNRGPPRISEAQIGPPEEADPRPPFVFERPEEPIRPFMTGVPIPEQIVPTMQQTYRPGFISQNRPPWQRPRPRPPISNNRRPMPPNKLVPPPLSSEIEFTTETSAERETIVVLEDIKPTDVSMDNVTYHIETDDNQHETIDKPDIEENQIHPTSSSEAAPVLSTSHLMVEENSTPAHSTSSSIELEPSITETSIIIIPSSSASVTPTLTTESLQTRNTSTKNLLTAPTRISTAVNTTTQLLNAVKPSVDQTAYHPRPGIVLDDPEFKPGGHARPQHTPNVRPTQQLPPGYGEIFDVTLSAIQGPGQMTGSKQTVHINPYGHKKDPNDIIISPSGDDGFVSIDGKRTYINLFGESTDSIAITNTAAASSSLTSSIKPTKTVQNEIIGTGLAIPEDPPHAPPKYKPYKPHNPSAAGGHYRPRPTAPPVRIDTCIVGDDSTCDVTQFEKCFTDNGVSSCHCRPGFARRKHREPCRKIVSLYMSLRVDKIYEKRIVWNKQLADVNSEPFGQLSYEAIRAIDSAMSMTPFSDDFLEAKVNKIYNGNASQGLAGVFVNLTLKLEENQQTLVPNVKSDIQKHLLGVIHRRNNNIGNSALYVESPPGAITGLQDVDECSSAELNDCHPKAICINFWGTFKCECSEGLRDPWSDQPHRAGRECHTCLDTYCNNRGTCTYSGGNQVCTCISNYYGAQCEIDGEVVGVAIGASLAALIIIVLTLVCLVMWSRKWHREQKNAMGSPVFGYMSAAQLKAQSMMGGQPGPYQVSLDDRMRWAQIADVIAAQSNHYGVDPVSSTRPSSAMFCYPNLQTMGTLSMAGTMQMQPPIPLPRFQARSNGMRTLENSSSSEEEDRTDLLGKSFQVPRPKSRSNGSITSGIYYDVDYAPTGDLYGTTTTSVSNVPIPGPQGIPMSTYTSGRLQTQSSCYMK